MLSWSVTSEKVISCVPVSAAGVTQQVACSAVIGVPSANVVAPAIAAKDRHITTMPAASRGSARLIDLALILTHTESAGTVVLCGCGQTPDLSPPSFP